MIYWQLFLSFFKIGLLGFGGGMAIIGLIQNEVEAYGWMTNTEFMDIFAISQMTPGPIGINCATYVGYTASGSVWGSLVATLSIMLPSLIIMMIISRIYFRISARWAENKTYQWVMLIIRALVLGLIAWAAYGMLMSLKQEADSVTWIIFGAVFYLTLNPVLSKRHRDESQALNRVLHTLSHPILLIVLAGLAGLLVYLQ